MATPAFEDIRLKTARLSLQPLEARDAPGLFAMYGDPVVSRYLSRPPWQSIDEAHAMIDRDFHSLREKRGLRLGMRTLADDKFVGECSLHSLNLGSRRAEVGYSMCRDAWGKGYMTEALTAFLDCAFMTLGFNRIEADIDPRNDNSAKSLLRMGFRLEGTLRERWIVSGEVSDSAIYGLLAGDWIERRRQNAGE